MAQFTLCTAKSSRVDFIYLFTFILYIFPYQMVDIIMLIYKFKPKLKINFVTKALFIGVQLFKVIKQQEKKRKKKLVL